MIMESISTPQVVEQYHDPDQDPDDNLNETNENIGNIEETDATVEPLEGLSLSVSNHSNFQRQCFSFFRS